jgi:hypothetical protein
MGRAARRLYRRGTARARPDCFAGRDWLSVSVDGVWLVAVEWRVERALTKSMLSSSSQHFSAGFVANFCIVPPCFVCGWAAEATKTPWASSSSYLLGLLTEY